MQVRADTSTNVSKGVATYTPHNMPLDLKQVTLIMISPWTLLIKLIPPANSCRIMNHNILIHDTQPP